MKSKKPINFKLDQPVMIDVDFKQMLDGVMMHRNNLLQYGSPFPPEKLDSALAESRKQDLDDQIAKCKMKIKELEDAKEKYLQLLRVISEEECRIKEEQKSRNQLRSEIQNNY